MIRFGGPIFEVSGDGDPYEIAKAHKNKGYTAGYAPQVNLDDKDRIREIKKAFADENIMIAEVGYWDNLMAADEEIRKRNLQRMTDAFYLAEELGAMCAVDIFGLYADEKGNTFTAKNFSEEAFSAAVDLARYLIDTVKPKTASFAYEIFPYNVVDCPESIEKLIKAVDRKQFGVHLDLVNLINSPRAYFSSGDIIRDCVKRFGDRIVAAHVKDIKAKEPAISVILEEVVAGTGNIDMRAFIREIQKLPQEVPFMMEHLSGEAEYDQAAEYIRKCAAEENIEI